MNTQIQLHDIALNHTSCGLFAYPIAQNCFEMCDHNGQLSTDIYVRCIYGSDDAWWVLQEGKVDLSLTTAAVAL